MEDKQHEKPEPLTLYHAVGLCNSSWTRYLVKPRKLTINSKENQLCSVFSLPAWLPEYCQAFEHCSFV